jgi:hypothetical protein
VAGLRDHTAGLDLPSVAAIVRWQALGGQIVASWLRTGLLPRYNPF